jgi:rhamnulokinase
MKYTCFAADLGASSGRLMVAHLEPSSFRLDEVYRFENQPVTIDGELYWDTNRLLAELEEGLRRGCSLAPDARSLAIDTWGTDFGLVKEAGALVAPPYSYREFTGQEMVNLVRRSIPDSELYALTGIQFIQVNTLFQLMAVKVRHPERLEAACWLLMMPDLLNHLLTGEVQAEYTNASTTHFLNPTTRSWETRIFERLGLPLRILPRLIQPGSPAGRLLPAHAANTGLPRLEVRSCASHDTASAVAAVPAVDGRPWAFISSGTWLLVGTETRQPYLTAEALAANVTNEAGVGSTIRLLKNLTGLWLVQRLRHDLQSHGQKFSFSQLAEAAAAAPAFQRFIAPNAAYFHNPDNMLAAIDAYCARTGQSAPQSPGQYSRCIFESLAFACADIIETLQRLTGQRFERIHVIGGGAQNRFLNACIANACGIDVYAGPAEATAIGNAAVQALADGIYPDLSSARQAIAASFPPEVFYPEEASTWDQHRSMFQEMLIHK